MEHPFIMSQPVRIFPEILVHLTESLPCVGLISERPEKDGRMVLQSLEITSRPVHHGSRPLFVTSRHIPGRLHPPQLLPGTVCLQISLRHNIDPVLIAEGVPASAGPG